MDMNTTDKRSGLRILSLGWGVQSWTLAAMAALGDLPPVDVAVHADTEHEHTNTYALARRWTPWLEAHGVPVVTVRPKNTAVVLPLSAGTWSPLPAYTAGKSGAGQLRRQCTAAWKVDPLNRWLRAHGAAAKAPADVLIGISLDEYSRMRTSDRLYKRHVYPLVDLGMTRADCVGWLERHDLPVPTKSACVFCPYHNRSAWRALKQIGGTDWEHALAVDAEIRDARPPHALYVHPARRPLAEAVSIPEDIGSEQLGLCDGGWCWT